MLANKKDLRDAMTASELTNALALTDVKVHACWADTELCPGLQSWSLDRLLCKLSTPCHSTSLVNSVAKWGHQAASLLCRWTGTCRRRAPPQGRASKRASTGSRSDCRVKRRRRGGSCGSIWSSWQLGSRLVI